MKIALIIPMNSTDQEKSFYDYKFYSEFLMSNKYVSYLLAIPVLAALTPEKHDIRIFDENIGEIDYSWDADIVGISVRTLFARRAYEISGNYRKKGTRTVLGGVHPSMCPDECLEHCDSVVVGEAEYVWHKLLEDAENGQLQKIYKADHAANLHDTPIPSRVPLKRDQYLSEIIQTTKGCPYNCEFCVVHAFDGRKIRHRRISEVIREIETLSSSKSTYKKKNAIFFADDNIIADKEYARELFNAIKPLKINWMCQASLNISKEDELLKLMQESGCGAVFIGFESLSQENLKRMNKNVNQQFLFQESISKIQSYGILVHSSFILGCDFDTPETFDELISFINGANLLMPLINIMTPFPGTELFDRLEQEGRILHKDWSKYDTKHVVFKPSKMTPEELADGYRNVARAVYSFDAILKKLNHYWKEDFWHHANTVNPVRFKYRLIFALRMLTLMSPKNPARSKFILKILPKLFDKHVRISTILTLMAYNDFAYSI